jgi:hypothetical protein
VSNLEEVGQREGGGGWLSERHKPAAPETGVARVKVRQFPVGQQKVAVQLLAKLAAIDVLKHDDRRRLAVGGVLFEGVHRLSRHAKNKWKTLSLSFRKTKPAKSKRTLGTNTAAGSMAYMTTIVW